MNCSLQTNFLIVEPKPYFVSNRVYGGSLQGNGSIV